MAGGVVCMEVFPAGTNITGKSPARKRWFPASRHRNPHQLPNNGIGGVDFSHEGDGLHSGRSTGQER